MVALILPSQYYLHFTDKNLQDTFFLVINGFMKRLLSVKSCSLHFVQERTGTFSSWFANKYHTVAIQKQARLTKVNNFLFFSGLISLPC